MDIKFWKTEWIVIGIGLFALNLYFFIINSTPISFLFTFIAISLAIVIVTLKLCDNEVQRESAFELLKTETWEPNESDSKVKKVFYSQMHEYMTSFLLKEEALKEIKIRAELDKLLMEQKRLELTKQKLEIFKQISEIQKTQISEEFYELMITKYLLFLNEKKNLFTETDIKEFLESGNDDINILEPADD